MNNSFGDLFRITTFGESHGKTIGVVIDGCPAGLAIDLAKIQQKMNRRRPGQSHLTTSRFETDRVEIQSGVHNGSTLGSPICLLIQNQQQKPQDYKEIKQLFRPNHGDYTYFEKYGYAPLSGGGRSSARETAARVASGAIAEQLLEQLVPQLKTSIYVSAVHKIQMPNPYGFYSLEEIEAHPSRCPNPAVASQMEKLIQETKRQGDSLGGIISSVVSGCPTGLGEPVFNKLTAKLAQAMLSLPASKAIEFGNGFMATELYGSENNDPFSNQHGGIKTDSNRSGGVQAGISNGEELQFKVGFKPPSTIFKPQNTVDIDGTPTPYNLTKGRHDPCVLPRAVPIVEAMLYLVLVDFVLKRQLNRLEG